MGANVSIFGRWVAAPTIIQPFPDSGFEVNRRILRSGRRAAGGAPLARFVTRAEALLFVRTHGVVLEAAIGPVPSLAGTIAGGPIRGSWWGHARSKEIFVLTRAVRDCPDVLVCRLVGGKISYVHRRLWPALVRVSGRFPRKYLAKVHEKHTASGKHVSEEIAFPGWVSKELDAKASKLDEQRALKELGKWMVV